ncbi:MULTISPECIES: helix-turn-helix transcriptional regulator [unclassified Acidisoma]|jgi:transcriptional regulator with XRE-family HTH domain|uniref:helix-turn-helix transcriptional regulator n=1 Tax=unclassified Acidisoma TaxID=2634065 RepID=UPI00131DF36E|nr:MULTISPECIES: helix-turn-helix transcriptional regulator [unclassified Acidisoma]
MSLDWNQYKPGRYTGITASLMIMTAAQRELLAAFVRARREALDPAAAGLPMEAHARRRTPGLRREEVAQLCGISVTWYTWIEQGRDISLSSEALARLASALHLSAAERAYLFELTRKKDPSPATILPSAVPDALSAVLSTTTAPAYLLDRLWHARAWNAAAGRLFSPWLGSGETSLLRYVFLDTSARDFIREWENRARRLLAEFRADIARNPGDTETQDMVARLLQDSPDFARFWNSHTVLAREGGTRMFSHPEDGIVQYEQVTLIPAAQADHKLVILLPAQT